jgi:hypothetical protein
MTALFDSFDLIEQILLFYDSLGFQQIYQSLLGVEVTHQDFFKKCDLIRRIFPAIVSVLFAGMVSNWEKNVNSHKGNKGNPQTPLFKLAQGYAKGISCLEIAGKIMGGDPYETGPILSICFRFPFLLSCPVRRLVR